MDSFVNVYSKLFYLTILASLLTCKASRKLLIRFISHPNAQGYLRVMAEEIGVLTNALRVELLKLEEADLLKSATRGQRAAYGVNTLNPFYTELASMGSKYLGFNDLKELALKKIINLQ